MAKHERRPTSPAPSRRARPGPAQKSAPGPHARSSGPPPSGDAPARSSFARALVIYEQAIRTAQQHNYAKAVELFRLVTERFPQERELVERAQTFSTHCTRQLTPPPAEPTTVPDRLFAATLALNAGETDQAIAMLEAVKRLEPENDQALYMLAIGHMHRGQAQVAIRYLGQAIAFNAENRALARLDPDLAPLREAGDLATLLRAGDDPAHSA